MNIGKFIRATKWKLENKQDVIREGFKSEKVDFVVMENGLYNDNNSYIKYLCFPINFIKIYNEGYKNKGSNLQN